MPLLALGALLSIATSLVACGDALKASPQASDFDGVWGGTSSMLFAVDAPSNSESNSHELFEERLEITHASANELILVLDDACVLEGSVDASGALEFEPQRCDSSEEHLSTQMELWGEATLDRIGNASDKDEVEIILDGTVRFEDHDAKPRRVVNARLRYHFRGKRL